MSDTEMVFWNRYGLISYLGKRLGKGSLRKTAIQKLVYLIQEVLNVPLGYKFDLYHYGPYSQDLAGDVDIVKNLNGIEIAYDPVLNLYNISPGVNSDTLIKKGETFIKEYQDKIESILSKFDAKRASELELSATILYAWKDMQARSKALEKEVLEAVSALKPKLSDRDIAESLRELKAMGYLSVSGATSCRSVLQTG